MTKTENKVFNDLFSVLFTACLSALVISCCEYFLIAVKPKDYGAFFMLKRGCSWTEAASVENIFLVNYN